MRTLLAVCLFLAASASYGQGTCPGGLPVTGTHCYFVAASGVDTNNGTTESTPWAHAPGMSTCANNCAAFGMPSSGVGSFPGIGIIFKGGDTWHFGNASATPYTGGLWPWHGSGTATTCNLTDDPNYVSSSSTCMYLGVDKTWFTGGSWTRPIMTGDNATSTSAVGSCTYQNAGSYLGDTNMWLDIAGQTFLIVDNFEWTGQCNNGNTQTYINERVPSSNLAQNRYTNNYAHGITHLAYACPGAVCEGNQFFGTSVASIIGPGNVCDGSDSDATGFTCMVPGGGGWLTYDNVWWNQSQMVSNGCHIWHDNWWNGYTFSGDGVAHGNQIECNNSAPQNDANGHAQPTTTTNLFYNNVLAHNTTGTGGDVKVQLAVNSTYPYYVFNNVDYDQGSGNNWNWGGTGITLPTGTQYFFNNTMDLPSSSDFMTCYTGMTYENNHLVIEGGTSIAGGDGGCVATTNVTMSHATAISQGYMANSTGTSGSNSDETCANDTTPCAPTSGVNSTVGAGTNVQSFCTALLGSSDAVVVRAGNACKNATTDGCAYNATTHTVTCPAQTATARPASAAWDIGAYQYITGIVPVNVLTGAPLLQGSAWLN